MTLPLTTPLAAARARDKPGGGGRRMKPEDVRFHHIRDWPWPQKWCQRHGWRPTFHECGMKPATVAMPRIAGDRT